jgi:hypothetical protein
MFTGQRIQINKQTREKSKVFIYLYSMYLEKKDSSKLNYTEQKLKYIVLRGSFCLIARKLPICRHAEPNFLKF